VGRPDEFFCPSKLPYFLCKSHLRFSATLALWASLGGMGCKREAPADATVKVAAAADLAFAFKDVATVFEKKTGKKVTFTFGSTGNLAKQIDEGAKYDLFAAANVSYVDEVVKAGACDGATRAPYALGRIVVWWKDGAAFGGAPRSLADLADARFVRIAIANPEHAPYGLAAQQALTSAGVWDAVKPRLVYGENVQQTLKYAQTGNVEAAIVALSLATVTEGGRYFAIEDALHKPIEQALVVCSRGGNARGGKDFAAFVSSPEGRPIMKRFGFLLPGETVTKAP
jgi:molybdate transport system substrate-binding protein